MKDNINAQLQFSPLHLMIFFSSFYQLTKKNSFTTIFNKSNTTYSLKIEVMLELFFCFIPLLLRGFAATFPHKIFPQYCFFSPILLPAHPACRFNFSVLQSEDTSRPLLDSKIFTFSFHWKLIFLPHPGFFSHNSYCEATEVNMFDAI